MQLLLTSSINGLKTLCAVSVRKTLCCLMGLEWQVVLFGHVVFQALFLP